MKSRKSKGAPVNSQCKCKMYFSLTQQTKQKRLYRVTLRDYYKKALNYLKSSRLFDKVSKYFCHVCIKYASLILESDYTVDSLYLKHPLSRTSLYLELKSCSFVQAVTYFSFSISNSLYLEQIFWSLASSRQRESTVAPKTKIQKSAQDYIFS